MADPLPVCYLNGQYLPLSEARISPLDRGFLYSDGVYELMPVYGGRPFRFPAHVARLARSLEAIAMQDPHDAGSWRSILGGLIDRNAPAGDCYLYWQVTRGAQFGRSHAPLPVIPRTVFAFGAPLPVNPEALEKGVSCITTADTRWARCDVKSVALLANVLLRQQSVAAGAAETILLREGELTEASASAVHVVLGGEVLMPPNSRRILAGTTRGVVEEMAARAGIHCRVVPVSEAQLRAADEIWLSAATRELQPVTTLDGHQVGSGRPGPLWRRVYDELQHYKRELAGTPW